MDPYLFKRIWRRPWLSLCTIVITVLMCVLMGYLMNYRQSQVEKLEETQQSLEIFCQVSNAQGTRTEDLRASQSVLGYIYGEEAPLAPYIRDILLTKNFEFWAPDSGIPEWNPERFGMPLKGMNSPKCWDWINPAMGGIEPTWFVEDFWNSGEFICLVSEGIYEQLTSDAIAMEVVDPVANSGGTVEYDRTNVTFTVAGTFPGEGQTVVIPFAAAQELAKLTTKRGSVDSISFYLADNSRLDEMTAMAAKLFEPIDPLSSSDRFALLIRDEQYRATTAVLEQNIQRTALLLPLVMLLGLGVGFLISFLATRNERLNYALMRTLGITVTKLFCSILREQLVPVCLGAVIGCFLSKELLPICAFLLCYSVGCTACIIKSIRVPPTAILREQE